MPLAGHANQPLKLVSRHNSVNLHKQLEQNEAAQQFSPFRANQYKETLPISPKVKQMPLSPREQTIQQAREAASYTDAPIVQHTLKNSEAPIVQHTLSNSNSFSKTFNSFSPKGSQTNLHHPNGGQDGAGAAMNPQPHSHLTSTISHWRATRGLDSPLEKAKMM